MSKSNRISIADAINIRPGDILREISPIQSAETIQSDSLIMIKSRQDLASNTSSMEELPNLTL
jgi:predicted PhzF superfamily epimerase YddE/YHI9